MAGQIPKAMKCRFCETTPRGFEGHPALGPVLRDPPAKGTAFACALCGCEWIRRHAGDGEFTWEPRPPAAQSRE